MFRVDSRNTISDTIPIMYCVNSRQASNRCIQYIGKVSAQRPWLSAKVGTPSRQFLESVLVIYEVNNTKINYIKLPNQQTKQYTCIE